MVARFCLAKKHCNDFEYYDITDINIFVDVLMRREWPENELMEFFYGSDWIEKDGEQLKEKIKYVGDNFDEKTLNKYAQDFDDQYDCFGEFCGQGIYKIVGSLTDADFLLKWLIKEEPDDECEGCYAKMITEKMVKDLRKDCIQVLNNSTLLPRCMVCLNHFPITPEDYSNLIIADPKVAATKMPVLKKSANRNDDYDLKYVTDIKMIVAVTNYLIDNVDFSKHYLWLEIDDSEE